MSQARTPWGRGWRGGPPAGGRLYVWGAPAAAVPVCGAIICGEGPPTPRTGPIRPVADKHINFVFITVWYSNRSLLLHDTQYYAVVYCICMHTVCKNRSSPYNCQPSTLTRRVAGVRTVSWNELPSVFILCTALPESDISLSLTKEAAYSLPLSHMAVNCSMWPRSHRQYVATWLSIGLTEILSPKSIWFIAHYGQTK